MNKDKLVVIGVVLALVLSGFAFFNGGVDGRDGLDGIGGASGPYHTEHQIFANNFTRGGTVTSTTTVDTTIILDASHLRVGVSLMSMNIGVDATITTMASTSAPLVNLIPGESFVVYFFNASTTAGSLATFAAGTGVDLQEDNGGAKTVGGNDIARLTFLKKADSDVILWIESGQEG